MQAKKRYLLVLMSCAFLLFSYYGGIRLKQDGDKRKKVQSKWRFFLDTDDLKYDEDLSLSPRNRRLDHATSRSYSECRMETCFDSSLCRSDFKVYVYPLADKVSPAYHKLVSAIQESRYYTSDPSKACVFVLASDTLDRDTLSQDYVKNMVGKLNKLGTHWNNGRNHVVFNLYSGTWPDYNETELGFDPGQAIVAKASASLSHFRPNFDVSLPLFPKNHPARGGDRGHVVANHFPVTNKFTLAFKGKRYVYGIGSETRNALHHLHNGRDMVLVTTCKHGKSWKDMKDDRCEKDNAQYDKFDYQLLLHNATFCLVPRGRRLGSFRFLEALQAGCIPVLLSNGWELPFAEVIDWCAAAVWADERLLLQVPDLIRSIPPIRIHEMHQQTQVLWDQYFSSIEKIALTTLEIIRGRVQRPRASSSFVWNTQPGALATLPQFSDVMRHYPFYYLPTGTKPDSQFTAVIYATSPSLTVASPLFKLVRNVAKSQYVARIVIIWTNDRPSPTLGKWPATTVSINIIQPQHKTISARFYPHSIVQTDAVLSLDEDAILNTEEVDFAFLVWQSFPERIVGYPARAHFWDDSKNCWGYTSKWTNDFSIVLTGAAFYHRYYNYLYTYALNALLHKTVDQSQNCEDILINFLVSHVTKLPPIKVTQRKQYKESMLPGSKSYPTPWNDPDHFVQRQTCINTFASIFGHMPLVRSNVRFDPVLFKDPVSNMRKKYRKLELSGG